MQTEVAASICMTFACKAHRLTSKPYCFVVFSVFSKEVWVTKACHISLSFDRPKLKVRMVSYKPYRDGKPSIVRFTLYQCESGNIN